MSIYKRFTLGLILLLAILVLAAADQVPVKVTSDNRINDTDVLAEFDGGKIMRKDIETKISKLPANYQNRYRTVDGQIEVLNITATEEAFYSKAKQMGLDKDPSVLERIAATEKRFYVQEYYTRNVSDLVILTEDDQLNFYNQNLKSFYLDPYITIDYIQVTDEAEGKKALAELKSGASFVSVSDKYNQNTYAKSLKGKVKNIRLNGNIPGIGNDSDLEGLIRTSAVDTLTYIGPVKTPTGWHIFRTTEWVAGHQKEYAEVKPEIEQRLRPLKERDALNALTDRLKTKYNVVIDSLLTSRIDLSNREANKDILDSYVVNSSLESLRETVKQLLDAFDKVPPQEQMYVTKGGGVRQLIDQELIQNLLYEEAKAAGYEKYFADNEDYLAMKRSYILRRAYEKLVVDSIDVTPAEIQARYERDLEQYATPGFRTIEVLFFDKKKVADKVWRKFNSAHKSKNEKKMAALIAKYSLRHDGAIFDNQYPNGVVTGLGTDAEFSKMIFANPVGSLSPVFTSARGEIVFFRTIKESPKTYKPLIEVEPRIYGMIKKEKEKTKQDQVSEDLFVELNMKKYPERIKILLTAEELFAQADDAARQRNFKDAIVYYDQIIKNYKNNVDDYKATFMKAFLVAEEMKNTQMALLMFKDFLVQFPEGDLNESARFMIDSLEGNIPSDIEDIEEK